MKISMLIDDNNKRVVFVSGVSLKAPAYKQIKAMFGMTTNIVFMPNGSTIQEMNDAGFAELGYRKMTDEERIAFLQAKLAKKDAPAEAATPAATDENGCTTQEDGECVSPGPCIHTPAPETTAEAQG